MIVCGLFIIGYLLFILLFSYKPRNVLYINKLIACVVRVEKSRAQCTENNVF